MQMTEGTKFTQIQYECGFLCDLLYIDTAKILAVYGKDFYRGMPCLTENVYGKGKAYYIGTEPNVGFLKDFFREICSEKGIAPLYAAQEGVEVTNRISEEADITFVINHNQEKAWIDLGKEKKKNLLNEKEMSGKIVLSSRDVLVLQREQK